MFPLRRWTPFSASIYESDEEDKEYWCLQLLGDDRDANVESARERSECINKSATIAAPTPNSPKQRASNSGPRIPPLAAGMCVLAVALLMILADFRTGEEENVSSSILASNILSDSSITASRTTSSVTQYGEVWLIRHGEKDPLPQEPLDTTISSPSQQEENIRTMYDLNIKGQDRAHHLASLARDRQWPAFAALFATRPATPQEASDAYPDFARDTTNQTLSRREYETILPLGEYLGNHSDGDNSWIHAQYGQGDVEAASLEIAKIAVAAASARKDDHSSLKSSPIVLVAWNHCSLPTLVVQGLGCRNDPRCSRCWAGDRFGDVLKLNVSLVTTTTLITTENRIPTKASAEAITSTENVAHKEYEISSTFLSMAGEACPGDDYYYQNGKNASTTHAASTPTSLEKSTPCTLQGCKLHPASAHLAQCSCWNSSLILDTLPSSKVQND